MLHAIALAVQGIERKQVTRPSVTDLSEGGVFATLDVWIRNGHGHLYVRVLVTLSGNEIALELPYAPDAHRIALRKQVDEECVLERRTVVDAHVDIACTIYHEVSEIVLLLTAQRPA